MAVNLKRERQKLLKEKIAEDRITGEALKAKRKSKGITAAFVAEALGFSAAYVCDLEMGRRHWSELLVREYRKAIGA